MKKLIIFIFITVVIIADIFLFISLKEYYNQKENIQEEKYDNKEFSSYMKNFQSKIKNNWNPPSSKTYMKTVLLITVNKDGNINDIKIQSSSGSDNFDKEAINAVKKSEPFEKFPQQSKLDKVDIQFTLDYNVKYKNSDN